MNNKSFKRIVLLSILSIALIGRCSAQQLKYQAEVFLDNSAIELKRSAINDDFNNVRFKVATSKLILGVAIWDQQEQLIYPLKGNLTHVSEDTVLNELHRLKSLLALAKPTAWELRTADGLSLLYCRKDSVSLCFILNTDVLAESLKQNHQAVIDKVLNKQEGQLQVFIAFALLFITLIFLWFYRKKLIRSQLYSNQLHASQQYNTKLVTEPNGLQLAQWNIDQKKSTIHYEEKIVQVSAKDIILLTLFAERPDEVISKEELYVIAWQRPFLASSRALDQHMMILRRKINSIQPNIIETIHGQGYRYNSSEI